MTTFSARVPKINWKQDFGRHWNNNNPAVTHAFNALSFLFPQGEQFFIDVTREVVSNQNVALDPELDKAVKGFIAQESIHSHQHVQYNTVLDKQGFENIVYDYMQYLLKHSHRHLSPIMKLAIVCGYEHYTAILGNFILNNPKVLESAEQDMALVWGWHSAEETEHKAVCFDLYQATGGGWLRRISVFFIVTLNFSYIFTRLYFSLLYRDNCFKPSRIAKTLLQSSLFFFGKSGIAWHLLVYGVKYLSPWFHPWDKNNRSELQAWLSLNEIHLRKING